MAAERIIHVTEPERLLQQDCHFSGWVFTDHQAQLLRYIARQATPTLLLECCEASGLGLGLLQGLFMLKLVVARTTGAEGAR